MPISAIDELLAYGWAIGELIDLTSKTDTKLTLFGFPETARRLGVLHRDAPETCGADNALLWHAAAAVLSSDLAGLTDLQALRWLQAIVPSQSARTSGRFVWLDPAYAVPLIREWVTAAGPDGWVWAAAGFTRVETQRLRTLPAGHQDRPGPDQLAVMAALRET